MKELLEGIKGKYVWVDDWEVLDKSEYVSYWEMVLKCKKWGKVRKKRVWEMVVLI